MSKNNNKKTEITVDEARALRVALYKEKQNSNTISNKSAREQFKEYFVQIKRKLNLPSNIENAVWLHLKAIGCDKPELFKKGIENFGYKL